MNELSELIQYGYEYEYLDFKEKQYAKDKHIDLVVDIMAMANSRHYGDKYIIIGIKDLPEGRIIKGLFQRSLLIHLLTHKSYTIL